MAKMVWDWGGGTFCQVHFQMHPGEDSYVAVLSGQAVLFAVGNRALYVGYGYDPTDTRLFRGRASYAPTHTGVIIRGEGGIDHVLTLQEFAQVVSAWEYAKEQAAMPTSPEDAERVQEGIPVGDEVIRVAREYFYHI